MNNILVFVEIDFIIPTYLMVIMTSISHFNIYYLRKALKTIKYILLKITVQIMTLLLLGIEIHIQVALLHLFCINTRIILITHIKS